ncbi:MAG: hypothetical protein R8J84_05360 [Mariprofundales bacterium]
MNSREEFFDISLVNNRKLIDNMEIECKWTMAAEAMEYRESMALRH